MMSDFAILRFKKFKGGAAGIEAHNERQKDEYKSNPDIQILLSNNNIHLIRPTESYNKIIKQRIDESGCRVRSNSIKFIDTVLTASPQFFQCSNMDWHERYFTTALEFMIEKIGRKNIISAAVHYDERTPHMHLTFVPMTEDNRLSAKDVLGGPKGLRQWQDDYFKTMKRVIPNLVRGKDARISGNKHIETEEFKILANNDDYRKIKFIDEHRAMERYIKSIPSGLKEEIDRIIKEERRRRNQGR